MKQKRRSMEEIIRIIRQADGGKTVREVCREHEIWSDALTKELPNAPAWYKTVVDENLKWELWNGKPDPTSKRAKNWKPIHEVLTAKRASVASRPIEANSG